MNGTTYIHPSHHMVKVADNIRFVHNMFGMIGEFIYRCEYCHSETGHSGLLKIHDEWLLGLCPESTEGIKQRIADEEERKRIAELSPLSILKYHDTRPHTT